MSGGVDSSACVALLKEKNADVIGCTFKMFDAPSVETSVNDAKKVADFLKIEHIVVDCRKDFKKHVMDCFVDAYKNGCTPNPCVICNKFVKFHQLDQIRQQYFADFMVTGHYAKISKTKDRITLHQARDLSKDQSYFLYRLNQNILKNIEFLLGDFLKSEVRDIAKKFGLPTAEKSESQDVCFIPSNDYISFFKKNLANRVCSGEIVDESGKILGHHNGIINYTIGQRKGLGLSGGPFFVKEIHPDTNTILVTDKIGVKADQINLKDISFINGEYLGECEVKIRSANKKKKAEISKISDKYSVKFHEAEYGAAKGQHCVFYLGDMVLGGGIIC